MDSRMKKNEAKAKEAFLKLLNGRTLLEYEQEQEAKRTAAFSEADPEMDKVWADAEKEEDGK
jgi:hypothetical protein